MLVLMLVLMAIPLYLGKCCLLAMYYTLFGHITRMRYQIFGTAILALPILASGVVLPILATALRQKTTSTAANVGITIAPGIVNLVVDLLILYIPIPTVAKMNLTRRRKWGVLAIFLTGMM